MGLVWLIGSNTGKELIGNTRRKINEAVSGRRDESYSEEDAAADAVIEESSQPQEERFIIANAPGRIFKRFRLE